MQSRHLAMVRWMFTGNSAEALFHMDICITSMSWSCLEWPPQGTDEHEGKTRQEMSLRLQILLDECLGHLTLDLFFLGHCVLSNLYMYIRSQRCSSKVTPCTVVLTGNTPFWLTPLIPHYLDESVMCQETLAARQIHMIIKIVMTFCRQKTWALSFQKSWIHRKKVTHNSLKSTWFEKGLLLM